MSLARAEEEKRAARPDFVVGSIQKSGKFATGGSSRYAFVPGNLAVVDFR
jgi:hypothetical protein